MSNSKFIAHFISPVNIYKHEYWDLHGLLRAIVKEKTNVILKIFAWLSTLFRLPSCQNLFYVQRMFKVDDRILFLLCFIIFIGKLQIVYYVFMWHIQISSLIKLFFLNLYIYYFYTRVVQLLLPRLCIKYPYWDG